MEVLERVVFALKQQESIDMKVHLKKPVGQVLDMPTQQSEKVCYSPKKLKIYNIFYNPYKC